ncbi:MAG: DUF962 domain-containing protein [Sphingobacteriales bacterium]|jgi:hypothetical protein|nr:MAG: DUF962 domain-containing protein [Sphingobacteriales bacterium]
MEKRYQTLKEFYPYYLTEHSDATCRVLHYIGTSLVIGMLIFAIVSPAWWKFALLPILGYGFAWLGHFKFEKNKPATFQYPLYSLSSDFIMLYHFLTGQIDVKLIEAKQIIAQQK